MVSKKGAKGIISVVAFFNGFSMEYGFSPWETLAVELWSSNLNAWAEPIGFELFVIIQIGTVIFTMLNVLLGLTRMLEYGKLLGVLSFLIAFLGGMWTVYTPTSGVLLLLFAEAVAILSPDYGF